MEELFSWNLNDLDIREMISINKDILNLDNEEIRNIISILKYINCSDSEIRNILVTNPNYLSRCYGDVIDLINKFKSLNIDDLNELFNSNPHLLNKDVFEIEDYINNEISNGKKLDDIIDELVSNPFIIDEVGVL